MARFRRFGLRLLLLGWVLWGGACTPASPPSQVLRLGLERAPLHLDPRLALDATSQRVIELLYNGLVRLDAQGRAVPDLAVSWETPTPTTYVFRLRRGVRFHDGSLLTAEDVRYTFASLLDPATGSPKRASFAHIRRIDVLAEDQVRFELAFPFAPFLANNLTLGIVPRPRAPGTPALDEHPVGTGPFAFAGRQDDGTLVLRAHAAYFEGHPALDGLELRVIPDAMVRLFALQKGTLDMVQNALPPDLLPAVAHDARFRVLQAPGTQFTYLGFNCEDPILRHVQVRQALAHALDRQALIQHLLRGQARLADGLLPPGHWAYEADVPRYAYDPVRAAQLLDAAGFPDPDGPGPAPRFRLQYKTSQSDLGRRLAEVVQEAWRQVGVAVDIRSYEWGTFYADIRAGNFQVYALTWVGVTDPDILYYVFHSRSVPPAGANRGRYRNATLDALLEQGRRAAAVEVRRRLYSQAQKLIAAELPYLPLWHETNVAVLRATFGGYRLSPTGSLRALQHVSRLATAAR
ncbi:MAG: peptide ABC transporter substrate-binding protein [Candidatus Tectimicrobiota bacterium]|nr:MAG: peptide ABC transporter substrate-binding protein [Candidatus Tectomicrobia bacterium]